MAFIGTNRSFILKMRNKSKSELNNEAVQVHSPKTTFPESNWTWNYGTLQKKKLQRSFLKCECMELESLKPGSPVFGSMESRDFVGQEVSEGTFFE